MGCGATKPVATREEVEAIVQKSQESAQKDQAVRESKAREQALKADKDALERTLNAEKEALERTLKESKELHAQTLRDLKEAREPKAAHEELLKAHEELLKAHEHLDDKHLHRVQEIEKFNKELKEHVDKMEASVGDAHGQIRGLKEEMVKSHQRAAEKENTWPALPKPREEPHSATRDVAATTQRGLELPSTRDVAATIQRGSRKNYALSTDHGTDGVDDLWTRRWMVAQPPQYPQRDQGGPSRLDKEAGHPNIVQDDDLEVQSLHGGEGDEENNPPTAGQEGRQVPADAVQHEEELTQKTAGSPRPPEPVTVSPPTAAALEKMNTAQSLLCAHAEKVAAGGLDSTRPLTAATRPPTAPEPEAKGGQLPEHGTDDAGKWQVKSMRKEDVIEVGLRLHKIMRESARAG